jgi:glucan-binding YG repeat protein
MSSSDEKNKNEEFMWCANLVETMPMSDMVSDLSSGATTNVSVEAWCDTPAYTQDRTTKYGLTKGEKKYADGALPKGHTWALDELETKSVGNNVYLCSDCHTATESTPHTVTLPDAVEGVKLTLGTINNTYIKDDTVTLTVEKEGTDIVTVTAKNGDTDVALTEVQEAAQDEAAAQATTEKAKTVYTFTMPDGDVTISVTKAAKTYAVNVATLTNGEITASAKEAAEKETVTLTAKPATGYALKAGSLKVTYKDADNTDKTVEVKAGTEANTYTFAMPAYPVNVSAEFVKEYKVTAAPADNGTVTVDPTAAVEGTDVTVTVTAADNYQLKADSLTYSYQIGEDKKTEKLTLTEGKATFKMPAADVTVSAAFEPVKVETYSVTATKGGEGTVKVNGTEVGEADTVIDGLKADAGVDLTIVPGTGAQLAAGGLVIQDSQNKDIKYTTGENNTYTFKMPADNVTVKVQFTTVKYKISTEVEEGNGTVTVKKNVDDEESLTSAPSGTAVKVIFKPADGWELSSASAGAPSGSADVLNVDKIITDGYVYDYTMGASDVVFKAAFTEKTTSEALTDEKAPVEERTAHGAAEKTTVTAMAVFTCTDKNCASAQFVDATVKQTSGVTTAAVTFNGKDYTAKFGEKNGWVEENGKKYWYEKGVKQGTTGRGKEIYDPDSDAWYWLDAVQGGAMTVSKDVYQESAAGQWADKPDGTGKWVRYDENGHMVKGWQTTDKGTYYFDLITGAMAKGAGDIDGVPCAFDEYTGIALDGQWLTIKGADFWYEKGVRQGLDGRGKEIYDPASDAWYWLDSVDQGKKATSKDVYQESKAGQWADRADGTGKWVRYDAQGHMIKGWSADKRYYFDPIYGTMAKGDAVIDGRTYHFDKNTGVLQ